MSHLIRTLVAASVFLGPLSLFAAESPTFEDWLKRAATLASDPSIVRYYTFEGAKAAADPINNEAGDKGEPLAFKMEPVGRASVPASAKDDFKIVEGRWPAKKAISLNQGYLFAKAPDVKNAFTAVMWFRKLGQGDHHGNNGTTNGTLLSAGCGYWDGWRVTTGYPSREINFEIGRPQPSHAVSIRGEPVSDQAWHHLAATWNGKEMRIYVDGELSAAGPFEFPYTPPQSGQVRIGFANAGVGSVKMDVDEVVLYNRALSAEQVFCDSHFEAQFSVDFVSQLAEVNADAQKRKFEAAATKLSKLLQSAPANAANILRFKLADLRRNQGKLGLAAGEYYAIFNDAASSPRLKAQAKDKLLALLKEGAGASLPREVSAMLLSMPELTPTERLTLRLSLAHSLAGAKDFPAARAEYAKIPDMEEAPPQWRSLAWICAAEACVRAKDYPAAKATFAKVKDVRGAPPHHVTLADERCREIDRLQAGQPARDPLASRTQLPKRPDPGVTLFVSPDGKDANAGTKESPFASIQRARDEIRAIKKRGALPAGGVTVVLAGGEYPITDTLKLDAQDSGAPEAPIVYRSAELGAAHFQAGARIKGFQPVKDQAILSRLPEEARRWVMQSDLKAQGITNLGKFELGGFSSGRGFVTHPVLELYFDDQPMPFSRWPNEGYVKIADLVTDDHQIHGLKGSKSGVFKYSEDRFARWTDEKEIWLYGYWFWDWADSYEKVAKLDIEKKEITLAPPLHGYGFRKGQRFCAVNLLSEIDRPGEWFLDRESGVLYFFPPSNISTATVKEWPLGSPLARAGGKEPKIEVSMFDKHVMELENVSHVAFEGLLWEGGRGDAISVKNGQSCLFAGCTIRKFGGNAIEIHGGSHHGVLSCDIHTLGRGGVVLDGGDRKTLTRGEHFVENCRIHNLSRVDHTYTPAVLLNGVSNRIAHNVFHDSNSSAMRVEGNDHVIEYNEIYRVLLESDDQGGSDMWGNPTFRGNIYRYNYWHEMGNGLGCGQAGIRLDDAICGVLIYGNVFQRCSDGGFGGVQIHGGKENFIENNVFVDCKSAVSFSAWGNARWKSYLDGHQKDYIQDVKATEPPYVARYPDLAKLYENNDSNFIWRNIVLNCGKFLLRDPGRNDLMDNLLVADDPGFADLAKQDFSVRDSLPLSTRLSFQPIPFAEIGVYTDAYRARVK
ncbi:MAG TPA: LamG-like jellyroll fold domain-containing protein [Planctomycetota bacterium]|jgi:hypothetical protein